MILTRQVTFSSGHRYWNSKLSEVENRNIFGEWASPFNHGHNYVLQASFSGKTDDTTGMVINIKEIDEILQNRIVSIFDQRSINDEVAGFDVVAPSLENLSQFVWNQLLELPNRIKLIKLKLYETPLLFSEIKLIGEDKKVILTRGYEFAASHRLHIESIGVEENLELFGKCNNSNGHGHNYELEVSVSGPIQQNSGMIADISEIDRIVHEEVVDRYDHKHLNLDIEEFRHLNPTTEVLTQMIWKRLKQKLPCKLERVVVRETARNIFEYAGEDE